MERGSGVQLVGQRWDKTFEDNAAMVEELWLGNSLDSLSCFGFDEYQAAEMKGVLNAFIRVHAAAGATAVNRASVVALLDLCHRVIMVVLNEIKLEKERGFPRNMPWVVTQLRSAMNDVAAFVETLAHERVGLFRSVLSDVVGTNLQRGRFEQYDVTLRGILAVVKSGDALPKLSVALSSTGIAPPIPEESKDSPALPLPWDAYDVAQSLHDFAEQLGRSQVRAVPVVELLCQRE